MKLNIQVLIYSLFFLCLYTLSTAQNFQALVFSKTEGFRHESIPAGQVMIETLGDSENFDVDFTENAAIFTSDSLPQYEVIIFLSTTGNILNEQEQIAFQKYIQQGGGYVGIHAASDTEHGWPWYGELVGAYFSDHPPGTAEAQLKVADRVHPSTAPLPTTWTRTDEWYNFESNPRGDVHVLATLDEQSYHGGTMGYDHPIAWCHDYDGGRAWYTAGGHTSASYSEPDFQAHVLGGIRYAAGISPGDFDATIDHNFEVSILDNHPSSPMALAVLPNLDVLYIERAGTLKRYSQHNGLTSIAGTIDVFNGLEDGLLGIVADPDFNENNYLYLCYSPAGNNHVQHVSRFLFVNDTLDRASEKVLLEIPTQRSECCHSGGDMEFDHEGNLYISTGDNTNPFHSNGYTPIDERNGRSSFDAQRTSGNTMDLRGKILRIKPTPDGSYTIPEGNLFENTNEGLPEIFAMGLRNPFRLTIDSTGTLYVGDVGPDASKELGTRGPIGYDEINRTQTAANFGWPYCIANNQNYVDYQFGTGISSAPFDCERPINNSPNNTGVSELPPTQDAWIWYSYDTSNEFPALTSGGRTAMAGAVYQYPPDSNLNSKFPAYFHQSLFIYDWTRNWIREIKTDEQGGIVSINPFLPSRSLKSPIDMSFGPDGAMYIVEWGTGFGDNNPDARITKIAYGKGARKPVALIDATPLAGNEPLQVNFSAGNSFDSDGNITLYEWDFDGDGIFDTTGLTASFLYTVPGVFNPRLKVTDETGLSAFASIELIVGNSIPQVIIEQPLNGGFYAWGEEIAFVVNVNDAEDGDTRTGGIDCTALEVGASIGHADHAHNLSTTNDCEGSVPTSPHGDDADDIFYVINARYSDRGANAAPSITGSATALLQPKRKEAEHFSFASDLVVTPSKDPKGGGKQVTAIGHNDYLAFYPMNLSRISHITFRAVGLYEDTRIELHAGSINGPILTQRIISAGEDWNDWDYYTAPLPSFTKSDTLYIVAKNAPQSTQELLRINWIEFHGIGMATSDLNAFKGLNTTYFSESDYSGDSVKTKDPMIAFNWENRSPVSGIDEGTFSTIWEGYLVVDKSDSYLFTSEHSGGELQVEFNNELIINSLEDGIKQASPIDLEAWTVYPIKVSYAHTNGNASLHLGWATDNTIHQRYYFTDKTVASTNASNTIATPFCYPNPFNTNFTVSFAGLKARSVAIYAADGMHYGTWMIDNPNLAQPIAAHHLPNGLYFLHIESEEGTVVKKLCKN